MSAPICHCCQADLTGKIFFCQNCRELTARVTEKYVEQLRKEIRETWSAARSAGGQTEAYRILERMVDRLGYGRIDNNPSLAEKV
ncbi:MAG: hypothetical protein ABFE07_28355 [Armatimonadia bacterium]